MSPVGAESALLKLGLLKLAGGAWCAWPVSPRLFADQRARRTAVMAGPPAYGSVSLKLAQYGEDLR